MSGAVSFEEVEPEIKDEESGFKWDTYHKDTIENAIQDALDWLDTNQFGDYRRYLLKLYQILI